MKTGKHKLPDQSVLEKLRKIARLAEQGYKGEADNARHKLENEVRKIYEATMLQFEKESLWGKVYHYEMRVCFNPYDTEAKRKRIETVNKIKEINEKIDTIRKQLTAPSLRQGIGYASLWENNGAPTP